MTHQPAAGVVLYAKDMERVATFYATVLGLERAAQDEEHVRIESPAFQLVVLRMPNRFASTVTIAVPPERRVDAAIKPVFFVPSIAGARVAAQALGGMVNDRSKEWAFNGWAVCDGVDPEGNVIQFRARPG